MLVRKAEFHAPRLSRPVPVRGSPLSRFMGGRGSAEADTRFFTQGIGHTTQLTHPYRRISQYSGGAGGRRPFMFTGPPSCSGDLDDMTRFRVLAFDFDT